MAIFGGVSWLIGCLRIAQTSLDKSCCLHICVFFCNCWQLAWKLWNLISKIFHSKQFNIKGLLWLWCVRPQLGQVTTAYTPLIFPPLCIYATRTLLLIVIFFKLSLVLTHLLTLGIQLKTHNWSMENDEEENEHVNSAFQYAQSLTRIVQFPTN
jgi:hypothetical protein